MDELASDSAKNVFDSDRMTLLPACFSGDSGVPCANRRSYNANAPKNVNCVQQGTSETGEGFASVVATWDKHSPEIWSIECIKALGHKTDDSAQSDSDRMMETFRKRGVWAICDILDNRELMNDCARIRMVGHLAACG